MQITEEFLLIFAAIMQIPMMMILLSRYLVFRVNRPLNIIAALISGSIQSFTVYMGGTLHYLFFSVFEIGTAIPDHLLRGKLESFQRPEALASNTCRHPARKQMLAVSLQHREDRVVLLGTSERVIAGLHGAADHDVVLATKDVCDHPVFTAAAEEIELTLVGFLQYDVVTPLRYERIVVEQLSRT